jgi:hypothetical protein
VTVTCKVCLHPRHDEIDRLIREGRHSLSALSAKFDLSISGIQRHRRGHVFATPQPATRGEDRRDEAKQEPKGPWQEIGAILDSELRLYPVPSERARTAFVEALARELKPWPALCLRIAQQFKEVDERHPTRERQEVYA